MHMKELKNWKKKMKNRAKCKLCEEVIESFHLSDHVECKCGEISIGGGLDKYLCSANDFNNFLRVDDNDNIIIPKIVSKESAQENTQTEQQESPKEPLSNKLIIEMLDNMIKSIEDLPPVAMTTAVNQYDYLSLLLLLSTKFKLED
jgi:hypothetical protein